MERSVPARTLGGGQGQGGGHGAPVVWHTLPVEQVLHALGTAPDGLSEPQARASQIRDGANVLAEAKPIRRLTILVRQFQSLLVGLLIAAGAVAGLLGEWIDAAAILAIVVLNALIGFFQEWRAEQSIAALRKLTAPRAKVRRDAHVISIPASEIVPGDIVLLEAGDLVPADLRVLEASALRCSEAALTGESEPVDKSSRALPVAELPLGDRTNLAFMGTSVAAGAGSGVVFATGMHTELGRIAQLLSQASTEEAQTPLEQRLHRFGRVLVWTCLAIVVLLFGLGIARGLALGELVLVSISLAVAAVPEGLPAVATVALALGVARMARQRALVRRLAAVETLGSANVICTDKTGTLTVGQMTVRELITGDERFSVTGEGYGPEGKILHDGGTATAQAFALLHDLLFALVACNDAHLTQQDGEWQVIGDPTEGALLTAGGKLGLTRSDVEAKAPRLHEWPFDPTRKRMSVARRLPDGTIRVLVKGAPEGVLERSCWIRTAQGVRPLTPDDREQIAAQQARMSGQALRVLGAAWRDLTAPQEAECADDGSIECDLVFAGLVGMYDPPRSEADRAVSLCREAGIRVVMITGDHPNTALAVAREIGIADEGSQVLGGVELAGLSDDELARRVESVRVYARVTAEDKLRIVRAWQARGAVVAMTGDGVNDAPAIRAADIGISMGRTGTEVTKQASDMIITDDDFASIVAAVEQGRGIFDNIRKALQYLLAGNAGELLLMAVCIALGYPVPLLPVHLLWINLVTDGLPALCLATDPIAADVMERPPRPRTASLTDRSFVSGVVMTGLLTAGTAFGAYLYGLTYEDEATARTYAFSTLVFIELLRAFSGRSETTPIWRMGLLTNARLAVVVAISFALQIAAHHVGPLQLVLETHPLPWDECAALVAVAVVPVAILELVKLVSTSREPLRPHGVATVEP
jgi:Ca2+-transporting ATPase